MLEFVSNDIELIKTTFKKGYEEIMKVKIQEGDPVEDFINWVTYIFTVANQNINYSANMNLLRYSKGEYLEAIGELVGVERVQAKGSVAKVKYTFGKIFPEVITIPAGHKVSNGTLFFELDEDIELKIGQHDVIGTVTCTALGEIGNDIEIGGINTIVDDIPFLIKVENLEITKGGTDKENDEVLRERIRLKPTAFSTAGPTAAYIYYAKNATPNITDVEVYAATPGVVKVVPLLKNGEIPRSNVLELVKKALNDDVRPFTDKVEVEAPVAEQYNINIQWWAKKGENIANLKENVNNAIEEYKKWQCEKLGRDINPNKLIQFLMDAGIKRMNIISPIFTALDRKKVAQINQCDVAYQGVEDE